MKLPLNQPLLNADDTEATEPTSSGGIQTVTLRAALIRAVLSEHDGDMQPVKGEDKIRRYNLFKVLKKATDDTNFDPEDIVVMRKAAMIFAPLSAGQVRDLLS
jgi:hypothetical protein